MRHYAKSRSYLYFDAEPLDAKGNVVDVEKEPGKAVGHVSTGGTFDSLCNPIIKKKLKIEKK